MSECLIYQLKLGTTMVRSNIYLHVSSIDRIYRLVTDSDKPAAIRLSGENILDGMFFSRIRRQGHTPRHARQFYVRVLA